jgi:hypothetical protein
MESIFSSRFGITYPPSFLKSGLSKSERIEFANYFSAYIKTLSQIESEQAEIEDANTFSEIVEPILNQLTLPQIDNIFNQIKSNFIKSTKRSLYFTDKTLMAKELSDAVDPLILEYEAKHPNSEESEIALNLPPVQPYRGLEYAYNDSIDPRTLSEADLIRYNYSKNQSKLKTDEWSLPPVQTNDI